MRTSAIFAVAIGLGAAACAPSGKTTRVASATPAVASDAVSTTTLAAAVVAGPAEEQAAPTEHVPMPTECEAESELKGTRVCVVPTSFKTALCDGSYPDVALAMFAKDAPWTRLWLAGNVDAWNASGGRTHRATLAFDEEVVVLAKHGAQTGGIVMTGATASYDVLRFDGSCVSVMEGELTTRRPPKAKPAAVPFGRLEEPTRHALLDSPKVKKLYASFEKACNVGDKKACEKAERALAQGVHAYVRAGGELPEASRQP